MINIKNIMTICFILLGSMTVLSLPTNETDIDDVKDVKQEGRDKKIWQNFLKKYAAFRSVEQKALKVIDNVMEWAWNANAYLNAIQTLAERGEHLVETLKDFELGKDNPFKTFVETIEFLEENIFQTTDIMLTFDTDNMKLSRERLWESTKDLNFFASDNDAKEDREKISKELKNSREFAIRYMQTMEASAVNPSDAERFGHLPEYKRHLFSVNMAANGMASYSTRDDKYSIDETINNDFINNLQLNDEEIAMYEQAEAKIRLNQNSLITTTSTHEVTRDGTMMVGMMILNEAAKIESNLLAQAFWIHGIERFSDGLRAEYELVDGKWIKK